MARCEGKPPFHDEKTHEQPFPVLQAIQLTGAAVLVSGASFAGLATAYWMNRLGYRVKVIEVARGLRKGGTPVDIEGETIGILARMGMIDAVRAKALPPRALEFKNADDSTVGVLEAQSVSDVVPTTMRPRGHATSTAHSLGRHRQIGALVSDRQFGAG